MTSQPRKRLPKGLVFARSGEMEQIRSCLDSESVQIVLVSGSSGVGKSTLLQAAVAKTDALLGCAKFDSQIAPLEAIQDFVNDVVRQVEARNLSKLCHERLHDTMEGEHKEILISVIPETRALLFEEEEKKDDLRTNSSSKESMLQLQLALKAFFRAVSEIQKVVLLLDDLHWCDRDSFDILLSTFTDPKASNIVLSGSYRDNEITKELMAFIETLSDALQSEAIHSISLKCFDSESVNDMLASLLNVDSNEETIELANLIHQRTDGNIFFMMQFLEELQREGLLNYNYLMMKWEYDVHRIQEKTALCENILQIVAQRIHRLEPPVQALLKLCACFGSRSNTSTLEICQSVFPEITDLNELLDLACREHLLDDLGLGLYKFSHDKVLESAKSMLPSGSERERLHWDIGILLFRAFDNESMDDRGRFICADQINVGAVRLASSDEERVRVAKLNLSAAKSASRLSAFRPACRYCQAGIDVLGEVNAPEIALALYAHYAEMLFCVGEMAQARDYCNKVSASGSLDHKVQSYLTMLQILLSEAKNQEVVDFGLSALRALGEGVSKKPSKLEALLDYKKTTKLLNGSTPEEILDLPLMTDSRKAACIQIMLPMLLPIVHLALSNLHTVLVGRMIRLTFTHGLTTAAPEAFAVAGVDAIAQRDDLRNGYQLGKLAASLADRLKATSVKARVYFWTSVFTQWWMEPLSQCLESSFKGYTAGMALGDQHYAFHCITCYGVAYVYSGLPLCPLLDDFEKFGQQMIDYGQFMVLFCIIPMCSLLLIFVENLPPLLI